MAQAHGAEVPRTREGLDVFLNLKGDLEAHMQSEEERIFPSIRALEGSGTHSQDSPLDRSGVEQMIDEHDEAGAALEELRDLSSGYTPPESACPKFRAVQWGYSFRGFPRF